MKAKYTIDGFSIRKLLGDDNKYNRFSYLVNKKNFSVKEAFNYVLNRKFLYTKRTIKGKPISTILNRQQLNFFYYCLTKKEMSAEEAWEATKQKFNVNSNSKKGNI